MISDQLRRCAVLLVATILLACDSQDRFVVDARYSEYLTVNSKEYEVAARTNGMATVKVIQVYAPGPSDGTSLREATRGRLLYESREPSEIEALFRSLQTSGNTGECDLGDSPKFILVAYDRDLPRAAVVRLYECDSIDGNVIGVRPVGDAGLDYSRAALDYLHEIGVAR